MAGIELTAASLAAATGGVLVSGESDARVEGFSIDSRTVRAGEWFFAIRGNRFDGHAFVRSAFDRGAAGVVVERGGETWPGRGVVVTDDSLAALQRLATFFRRKSGATVTAITGSAGKTTTKEMTATLLEQRYSVFRNRGNLNNHIGLPLSLLELRHAPEMAVVELGMNHAGEIRQLVHLAEPDIRVWTNVGPAHLEFFESVEAIAEAKAEILEEAAEDDLLVANADDPRVMSRARGFAGRLVTFGLSPAADVSALDVEDRGLEGTDATLRAPQGSVRVSLSLPGRVNLSNLLAASAVALSCDVPLAQIASAVSTLQPVPHRGTVRRLGRGITVIDDSYNSNPAALACALELLASTRTTGRRVAVVGEMLELGREATSLHEHCGRLTQAAGVGYLVTIGGDSARALGAAAIRAGMDASAVEHVPDAVAGADLVADRLEAGDIVLVKGSRGVATDRVVERVIAHFGEKLDEQFAETRGEKPGEERG